MNDSASLETTDEVIEKKYDRWSLSIELAHANPGSNANNFTVSLPNIIKDVVGICLVGVELQSPSSSNFNTGGVYVSINNFDLLRTGNNSIPPSIYRFYMPSTGVTINHLSNPTNLGMNVYTYVPDPIIPRLDRIMVNLYTNTGAKYTAPADATVCINLAIYAKRNKYSRV